MTEWTRKSISNLIKEYQQHRNLYNSKHALYYNKKARIQSLNKIAESVSKTRAATSADEVHKKIQTLRTQIGQEIGKIEKSRELGDDSLLYVPKVWWFESLEWVAAFMKGRNDPTTPLSAKLETSGAQQYTKVDLFNDFEEDPQPQETSNIEFEEFIEEPEPKKARKSYPSAKSHKNDTVPPQQTQAIQFIISQHENTDNDHISNDQILEIQPENISIKDTDRYKKRSKGFGKYVASLMLDIKNDKVFFETQSEILKIIEQATLKSF